jgi:hypothetical protein
MIGTTLQFVTRQINQFLCNQLQIDAAQRKIILASHVSADGTFGGLEENSLLLCLIGIRRESNANRQPSFPGTTVPSAGSAPLPAFVKRAPPLHLNLQVLLAANFRSEQIESGLNLLTLAMLFLQSNPAWEARRFPGMPAGVGDLAFEVETLNYQEQSHLWGAIGAKYMPSIVYKLRLLTLDAQAVDAVIPGVHGIDARAGV